MNKLIFIFVVIMMISCSPKGWVIQGNISGDEAEGKTVYLYKGVSFYKIVVDSAVIKDGRFEFHDEKLVSPDLYTIMFFPDDTRGIMGDRGYAFRPVIPVFLDEGTYEIRAEWDKIRVVSSGSALLEYRPYRIKEDIGQSDFQRF